MRFPDRPGKSVQCWHCDTRLDLGGTCASIQDTCKHSRAANLDKFTFCCPVTALITTPTQCPVYHAQVLIPVESPGSIVCWAAERHRWRKTGHSPETEAARQSPLSQNTNSASALTNRHREVELLSFPLHRRAIIHSQRISLSFWPASWERGRKCGCFWSSAPWVCASICLLVINGGSSNICSFSSLAHDTQPVFSGSDTPQILGAKFSGIALNVVTQWLPSFRHEQKQIIVFINSCRRDAPTHPTVQWTEERGMSNFCLNRSMDLQPKR